VAVTRLFDEQGQRLFFNLEEREAFLKAAHRTPDIARTFCCLLHYTGCNIPEARNVTASQIDFSGRTVVLESATTSRYDTTRAVPIPDAFLGLLDEVHDIRRTQQPGSDSHGLIWPQCNKTMYDKVGRVIAAAGIDGGPHATPRGIRYGFLVHAIRCRVILSRAERWMGFSQTSDRWHYVEQLERLAPELVRDERTDASLMW
jgi:integrase/recombinase XerD